MIATDAACHAERKMLLPLMGGRQPAGNVLCPSVSLGLCGLEAFLNALPGR